jgi:hypothetical protein
MCDEAVLEESSNNNKEQKKSSVNLSINNIWLCDNF